MSVCINVVQSISSHLCQGLANGSICFYKTRNDWRQKEKRAAEDEMVGWHRRDSRCESERTPGDGEAEGSLACCCPGSHRESVVT